MSETFIQIGCNYHTKWQSKRAMRFVLVETKGDKARLVTRCSKKDFWTNVSDLIFIETKYNRKKSAILQNIKEARREQMAEDRAERNKEKLM